MDLEKPFETWAVVEVMGHVRLAGWVTTQTVAGTAFVRVDVPELPAIVSRYGNRDAVPAFTKLLGGGSIYAITPCTEAVAKRAAESFRASPLQHVDLVKRDAPRLAGPDPDSMEEEPPEDEDDGDEAF